MATSKKTQSRPPIPKKLQEEIKSEAGYRCALPTCRDRADIDLHHIVPWSKCKEHKADNLIALCPNCHRSADRGRISQSALRKYKKVCQDLQSPPERYTKLGPETFIKFKLESWFQILNGKNISSITDVSANLVQISFSKPLKTVDYILAVAGDRNIEFEIIQRTTDYVSIRIDTEPPFTVEFRIQL